MNMKNFIVKFISTYKSFDSQWEENKLIVIVILARSTGDSNLQLTWA